MKKGGILLAGQLVADTVKGVQKKSTIISNASPIMDLIDPIR